MVNSSSAVARRARPAVTCAAVALTACALVGAGLPAPRPLGIGDRLFPTLGNPGYDVRAYDISLRYAGRNTAPLQARTVIDARVTAPAGLARLNLDFAGGKVLSLRVNGAPARHTATGEDLAVTPATPLRAGDRLRVEVRHTSPTGGGRTGGWIRTEDGLAMANQADAAHRVFPANDHPSDKALFTFHVTAPSAYTVVAGGRETGRVRRGADTVWTYRMAHPMATELAQVSIGRSTVLRRTGPHGLPLRDVVPRGSEKALKRWLAKTPEQLTWLERQVGRYPFENYGVLMADASTGFELETQTLSLFEKRLFAASAQPSWYKEAIMVHELSHQWFGDSVTPRTWDDLWLNEGHATWYEWTYGAHRGGPSLEKRVRAAYGRSDGWRKQYGPPARQRPAKAGNKIDIFRPIVYDGSAIVLYALREKIGPAAFARLERRWVTERRDGNATTADFVRLAGAVAGQDLTGFFRDWLYAAKTPPMPGHPRWSAAAPEKPAGKAPGPGQKAHPPAAHTPGHAAGRPAAH